MTVVISDDLLQAAQISEADLKLEIAILLYQQKRLSIGKARELAGMHLLAFQQALAQRGICLNYDIGDLQHDVQTLKELGDL
jgi:predicted HTH domain antitoxin